MPKWNNDVEVLHFMDMHVILHVILVSLEISSSLALCEESCVLSLTICMLSQTKTIGCWRSLPCTSGHLSNILVILLSNLGLSNCLCACLNLNPLLHLRLVRGMYPHLGHLQYGLLSSIMALVHHNWQLPVLHMPRLHENGLSIFGKEKDLGSSKHIYYMFVFFMQGGIRRWQVHSCSNIHVP